MRPATKVSRMLATLVVADLASAFEFTSANGPASGFAFTDRMSRTEAERLIRFVRTDKGEVATQIREAYQDKNHPAHTYARTIGAVVNHFALEHAQDASGAPAAWTEREPPTWDPKGETPFAAFNAEEAAALLEWSDVQPGDQAARMDTSHPAHEAHARLVEQLTAVAYPEGAPAASSDAASGAGNGLTLEQRERVREIEGEEAYRNKSHPSHKALVDEMSGIYAKAFPRSPASPTPAVSAASPRASSPTPSSAGALSAAQQQRLTELQKNPAYTDKRHPDHATAVADVSRVYAEAFPAAPAAGGGG